MMPSAMAATPERSMLNVALAPSRPPEATSSVSPMRRSLPTRTSERNSSPVGEECMPILRSGLDCSRPGMPASRTKRQHLALGGRVALVELADEDDRVGVGAVGDERLRAVEDVLVAVAPGGRLHRAEGVGAGVGLGDGPGADLLQRQQLGGPPLLLGDRALADDRRRGEAHRHAHGGDHARAQPAQLDDRDQRQRRRSAVALALRPLGRGLALGLGLGDRLLEGDLLGEPILRHRVHAEGRRTACGGRRRAGCRRARTPRRSGGSPCRRTGARPCAPSAALRSTGTRRRPPGAPSRWSALSPSPSQQLDWPVKWVEGQRRPIAFGNLAVPLIDLTNPRSWRAHGAVRRPRCAVRLAGLAEEFDTSSSNRGPGHRDRILANDPSGEVNLFTVD